MNNRRQTIRDFTAESNLFLRRCLFAVLLCFTLILVVLNNLYSLQVEQFEDYQIRADGNRIKVIPVAPNRGIIYDRNGTIIAENRPVFNLEVSLEQVEDLDTLLDELQQLLELTPADIARFERNRKRQRRFHPVTLIANMDEDMMALFSAQQHRFDGVAVEASLARYYPYGSALTHVLGYVSKINARDLNLIASWGAQSNYAASKNIGKQGVERYYEERLHGKVGYAQLEVDSKGRTLRILEQTPPQPGEDLILNIDIELQLYVQSLLADKKGSVVVSDPSDGGILAMYSSPSYDPNLFVNGISQKDYSKLIENNDRPLLNRAVQGQYPPASLIKPHLALLGLESQKITDTTHIQDKGYYQLEDVEHVWRDWLKRGHGKVDVQRSIVVSCDTFFYELAYKLGIDTIHEYMAQFGFGEHTNIDLLEESDGNLPSRGWKRARFNQPWYIGDTISVGIGQGYWTATPVQLVDSINTIINYGVKNRPKLLKASILDDLVITEPLNTAEPIRVLQKKNWDMVQQAMFDTVNIPQGTAFKAFRNSSYASAGKTGTAQLFSVGQDEDVDDLIIADYLKDNAMYLGYAPAKDPKLSVIVALENAGGGGSNAAPISRSVMDYWLGETH
ncbi:MAG TPA: penicillin-binding protein 2 [Glaciecola sp.]|nr:penicillin-binding protein 2 [Glaciecola sp.]